PLSENDFLKLLKNVTNLNSMDVEEIVKVANRVPRELMRLDTFVQENSGLPFNEALSKFEVDRKDDFAGVAENYYKRIKGDHFSRERFFHGLAQAFLYGSVNENFKWDFLDLGLLYRFKRDGSTLFLPLCNATQKALLELFKLMPMPENLMRRLKANNINGDDFERVFFHALICASKPIMLTATNLDGEKVDPIVLNFDDYQVISRQKHSLGPGKEKFMARGYPRYPRFDFMIGPMFIQVSMREFEEHNGNSGDFQKAFERPYKDIFGNIHAKNQIECYLDEMYGGDHKTEIIGGKFVVTRKDPKTDQVDNVPGFRIVYICGRDIQLKRHPGLADELKDVAH
ncbi:hypothetical protein BGX20_006823, partial [Mortierella sp. AD010]